MHPGNKNIAHVHQSIKCALHMLTFYLGFIIPLINDTSCAKSNKHWIVPEVTFKDIFEKSKLEREYHQK